jgi:hypothetical protein
MRIAVRLSVIPEAVRKRGGRCGWRPAEFAYDARGGVAAVCRRLRKRDRLFIRSFAPPSADRFGVLHVRASAEIV